MKQSWRLRSAAKWTWTFVSALRHLHGDSDDRRAQEAIAYISLANQHDYERWAKKADTIFQSLSSSMKARVAVLAILECQHLFLKKQITELDWEFLDRWLKRIPKETLRLRLRATCLFGSGHFDEGEEAVRAAIQLTPDDASLYFFLAENGYGMYRPGDYETLINLTGTAVDKDPNNIEYRSSLAFWLLKSGQREEAGTQLTQIESAGPHTLDFWPCINLALTYGVLNVRRPGRRIVPTSKGDRAKSLGRL